MCKRFYNIYNDCPNRIFQSINLVSNVQLNDWTRSKVFRRKLFQQKQVKASEEILDFLRKCFAAKHGAAFYQKSDSPER